MRTRTYGVAAVLLLALLNGCGSAAEDDGGSTGDEDLSAAEREDAMLDFAACMRDNGVPMDDPEPGGRGGLIVNGQEVDQETLRAAEEECHHLIEDALPEEGEMEIDPEQREAMLAQAQCMRERGWDMPDPTFDGGRVEVGLGEGIDPADPAFQKDHEECAEESGVEMPRMEGAG